MSLQEQPESFDVFLSHNSKDKPAVRELAEKLQARGLRVWLDEWELVPGRPWQIALEKIIQDVKSAAVLVGKDGLGPWEEPEMRACLSQFVRRKLPVIPVLLPDAPTEPSLPLFLHSFTWVDLRGGLTDIGIDRLQWGVTGIKPAARKSANVTPAPTQSSPTQPTPTRPKTAKPKASQPKASQPKAAAKASQPAPTRPKASQPMPAQPRRAQPVSRSLAPFNLVAQRFFLSATDANLTGQDCLKQKKYSQAEAAFCQAAQFDPKTALYQNNLGVALSRQNKFAQAEAAYRQAVKLEPKNAEYQYSLGAALSLQNKFAQAEAAYRQAANLEPKNAEYQYSLGAVLFCQEKYAQAEAAYKQAVILEPKNAVYQKNLSNTRLFQTKYAEAFVTFPRAEQLAREAKTGFPFFEAGLSLSHIFAEQEHFEQAKNFTGGSPLATSFHGKGLRCMGDSVYELAQEAFRHVVALEPKIGLYRASLGFALYRLKRVDEARQEFQEAVRLGYKNKWVSLNKGDLFGSAF